MPTRQALELADERQLDRVKIAPNAKPPVCKLMDYDKYRYEQAKKEREIRKNQKVVSIKEFGAFLEFAPGKEAMVHISKIANARINKVEDVLQIGDVVRAICLGKDKMGRISFSIKDVPTEA